MLIEYSDFERVFSEAGLPSGKNLYLDFSQYAYYLDTWNKKINLTAITEPKEVLEKHFLDSVLPLKMIKLPEKAMVIDVGTGAGFPSVPMKLIRRDIQLTLLDSLAKRINFLEEVSEGLNLQAVCTHARAEDMGRSVGYREQFDMATARAVAALPALCEYCLPFVKVGGIFLAMKGPNEDISAADKAITTLGGKIEKVERYNLPSGDERTAIIIRKIAATPAAYPRKGNITKKPIT